MSSPPQPRDSVWVRVAEWMWVDGELPTPVAVSVLPSIGVRVLGRLEHVASMADEGIRSGDQASGIQAGTGEYVVTGSVVNADAFQIGKGSGARHAGAELVLTVDGVSRQAHIDGLARDVNLGDCVSVRGRFA